MKKLNVLDMLIKMQKDDKKLNEQHQEDGEIIVSVRPKIKKPNLYRVLLLNDDYTPMDFVILILETFFKKTREQATEIMLNIHRNGIGECGIYTYEVAESKMSQVMLSAKQAQHPLQCVIEKK